MTNASLNLTDIGGGVDETADYDWTGHHTFDGGLTMGTVEMVSDSGAVKYLDMGVTTASSQGSEQSIAFAVDDTDILKVYAEADGAGGIQNGEVHLSLSDGDVDFVGSDETNDGMTADPETATEDGYITVSINGSTYQIPVYSA